MIHGKLLADSPNGDCRLCAISSTDQYLEQLSINSDDIWRNVGLLFVYIAFNAVMAVFLYWLIRVPKKKSQQAKKQ
jgi:ABC-type multidrug transport system permease subunit